LVKELEKAGVPVVFIDFRAKPVAHTLASMRILGKAIHREAQAEAYAPIYVRLAYKPVDTTVLEPIFEDQDE